MGKKGMAVAAGREARLSGTVGQFKLKIQKVN
jgi:hypothetical protein